MVLRFNIIIFILAKLYRVHKHASFWSDRGCILGIYYAKLPSGLLHINPLSIDEIVHFMHEFYQRLETLLSYAVSNDLIFDTHLTFNS